MQKLLRWFFPILSLVIFGTLLWAMLLEWAPRSAQNFMSFALGLLAYSMMLTLILIAVRPKAIEHRVGLPEMYAVHGWIAMILFAAVIVHFIIQWNGFGVIFAGEVSTVSLYGFIGAIFLVIVMLTGIFVLSNTFIKRSKILMQRKEKSYNRNRQLWLHRLSILSIIAIYFHITSLGFLSSNTIFMVLFTSYTVLSLGWYFLYKLNILRLPKYEVNSIRKTTPTFYELELKPAHGNAMMDYKPGQYAFLRFVDSSVSRESHPFSLSSAPEDTRETVQIMIKEAGDFTRTLGQVKAGDKVTLEGPYGNYFPHEAAVSDTPIVLLSGGIGVTPNLSILRHEMAQKSNRKIIFVWGLAHREDLMLVDQLDEWEKEFPNFSYHIIFSNEEVSGYEKGFITRDYLAKIGVAELFQEANFYICGPAPMIDAMKKVLAEERVSADQIYLEEFSF